MKEHAKKKHTVIWIKCDYCHEKFDTIYNKKQHEWGAHGEGWKAPCGEKCAWPGKLCAMCIDKTQRSNLAKKI